MERPRTCWTSGRFNTNEETSIFSMWCELAAPMITPTVSSDALYFLTNAEAIAVDQDAAGIRGGVRLEQRRHAGVVQAAGRGDFGHAGRGAVQSR